MERDTTFMHAPFINNRFYIVKDIGTRYFFKELCQAGKTTTACRRVGTILKHSNFVHDLILIYTMYVQG